MKNTWTWLLGTLDKKGYWPPNNHLQLDCCLCSSSSMAMLLLIWIWVWVSTKAGSSSCTTKHLIINNIIIIIIIIIIIMTVLKIMVVIINWCRISKIEKLGIVFWILYVNNMTYQWQNRYFTKTVRNLKISKMSFREDIDYWPRWTSNNYVRSSRLNSHKCSDTMYYARMLLLYK